MFNTKRIKRLEAENSELKAANNKLFSTVQTLEALLDAQARTEHDLYTQQQCIINALQPLLNAERAKHKRPTEYLRGLKTAMDIVKGAM